MAEQQYKNFTELDFENIKQSLKTFMENQDHFKDYNFEGSGMSVLLDLLAFTTQYNAFYGNMLASERLLPLAQKRKSVVDLAANLGYTPRSRRSAQATLSFNIVPSSSFSGSSIVFPANVEFNTKIDGDTYTFINPTEITTSQTDGSGNFVVDELIVYEGKKFTHRTEVANSQTAGLTIPNPGVDTSRLTVIVKETSGASSGTTYQPATDFTQIDASSNVYFLDEVENEKFRVYFGDGTTGRALSPGNIIEITYYVSSGDSANGAQTFTLGGNISSADIDDITFIAMESGSSHSGDNIESTDSVRMRAPLYQERQNRAANAQDAADIVKDIYPSAQDITAWGGETNDPPIFGAKIISIIPQNGFVLSTTDKNQIKDELATNYDILGIGTEIFDPNYLYIKPTITANYNAGRTNPGANTLKNNIESAVIDYDDANLARFNAPFEYSRFVTAIDNVHSAIENNVVDLEIYYYVTSLHQLRIEQTILFNEPVTPGSVYSDVFDQYQNQSNVYIQDDENGTLNLLTENQQQTHVANIGTVNYTTGRIAFNFNRLILDDITFFLPSSLNTSGIFKMFATPENDNITPVRNQVITVDREQIVVRLRDTTTGNIV